MNWWRDMSKAQVLSKIREQINPQPENQPFECELLSDLLMEHHPDVIRVGIRPTAFRKTTPNPYGGRYLLEGLYGERWIKNSFNKAINPPSLRDQIFSMFRAAITSCIKTHMHNYPLCSLCGAMAEDVDHVSPSFLEIAERLYQTQSESHWQYWIDQHRWEDNQPLRLPEHHPAVIWLRYTHSVFSDASPPRWIRLQSLCKPCHYRIGKERKQAAKNQETAS